MPNLKRTSVFAGAALLTVAGAAATGPTLRVNGLQLATQSTTPAGASAGAPIAFFDTTPVAPRLLIDNGTGVYDVLGNVLDVRAYGAKLDGQTDDSRAIENALHAVSGDGGVVRIPDGNVRVSRTLVLDKRGITLVLGAGTLTSSANPVISITASNVTVRGAGYFATDIYSNSASNDIIVADGRATGLSGIAISDLSTDSHSIEGARTSGQAVRLVNVGDWRINNVYLHDPWIGLSVDHSNTGFATNITMNTTLRSQSIYDGVQHVNHSIQNHFERVLVTSASTPVHAGFSVGNETDSFICDDCLVQASGARGAAYGFLFHNETSSYDPRWIKVRGAFVEVDRANGIAFQLDHVRDAEITDAYSAWAKNNFRIGSAAATIKIRGGTAQLAHEDGVLVEGGDDIHIDGLTVESAGLGASARYDGISVRGGTNIKITNCTSGRSAWATTAAATKSSQRYGISTDGDVDYYWIVNNSVHEGDGHGIHDVATGKHKVVSGNL
jgi:polygalacturonase